MTSRHESRRNPRPIFVINHCSYQSEPNEPETRKGIGQGSSGLPRLYLNVKRVMQKCLLPSKPRTTPATGRRYHRPADIPSPRGQPTGSSGPPAIDSKKGDHEQNPAAGAVPGMERHREHLYACAAPGRGTPAKTHEKPERPNGHAQSNGKPRGHVHQKIPN